MSLPLFVAAFSALALVIPIGLAVVIDPPFLGLPERTRDFRFPRFLLLRALALLVAHIVSDSAGYSGRHREVTT